MASSSSAPRFVPTLTEVVRPAEVMAPAKIDVESVVEQVIQRLSPKLEDMISTALHPIVQEQLRVLSEKWNSQLEESVRTAVADVVTEFGTAQGGKRCEG